MSHSMYSTIGRLQGEKLCVSIQQEENYSMTCMYQKHYLILFRLQS